MVDPVSDFTTSLDGLTPGQLEDVAEHLSTSYHLLYGTVETNKVALFGHLGTTLADVQSKEPPAVFLRELADAVRAGGPVKVAVPRHKADAYRVSELLHQSARRAARDVSGRHGAEAAAALARMTRDFDDQRRLSGDELERAEWVSLPGQKAPAAPARII